MHDYCDVLFRNVPTSEPAFGLDGIRAVLANLRRRDPAASPRLESPSCDGPPGPVSSAKEPAR